MYTPPGTPRSRSFTRLTMRVGFLHLGQSVDFVVSITFLRSPVLAILAIGRGVSPSWGCFCSRAQMLAARLQRRGPEPIFRACLWSQRDLPEGSLTRSLQFTSRPPGRFSSVGWSRRQAAAAWPERVARRLRTEVAHWPVAR